MRVLVVVLLLLASTLVGPACTGDCSATPFPWESCVSPDECTVDADCGPDSWCEPGPGESPKTCVTCATTRQAPNRCADGGTPDAGG